MAVICSFTTNYSTKTKTLTGWLWLIRPILHVFLRLPRDTRNATPALEKPPLTLQAWQPDHKTLVWRVHIFIYTYKQAKSMLYLNLLGRQEPTKNWYGRLHPVNGQHSYFSRFFSKTTELVSRRVRRLGSGNTPTRQWWEIVQKSCAFPTMLSCNFKTPNKH